MFRLLLAFTLAGERGQRPNDGWFGADKVKHFFSAAFVQSVAYSATRAAGVSHGTSLAVATGVTAGASVGKELWDAKGNGTASGRDLVWDAVGAAAATLLLRRSVH